MDKNEIMTELRSHREQYAKSFNDDLEAIFRDAQERQRQTTDREVIALRPRQVEPTGDLKRKHSA